MATSYYTEQKFWPSKKPRVKKARQARMKDVKEWAAQERFEEELAKGIAGREKDRAFK